MRNEVAASTSERTHIETVVTLKRAESKAQARRKVNLSISSSSMALDVHAASIVVVRMLDGAKPQPPQTFNSGCAYDCSGFPSPSRRALARARAAAHKS